MAKSYAFSNAHTHSHTHEQEAGSKKGVTKKNKTESICIRAASEEQAKPEPYRTGLKQKLMRSMAQFMQIQSQSLAALLVAFYDGLQELQVLALGMKLGMAIDGNT